MVKLSQRRSRGHKRTSLKREGNKRSVPSCACGLLVTLLSALFFVLAPILAPLETGPSGGFLRKLSVADAKRQQQNATPQKSLVVPSPSSSASKASVSPATITKTMLSSELLHVIQNADDVWNALVDEGVNLQKKSKTPIAVMEVGVHRATQCMHAAKSGLQAHCVEPSPKSFQRIQNAVRQAPTDVSSRINLYNVAAGPSSEGSVAFTSTGGTGDHVGKHDMWRMEQETLPDDKSSTIINIPSKKMDDIIQHGDMSSANNEVFLLKVDTQGFEPAVFSGLQESLKQHKIKFILTEYWPRGMDLLMGQPTDTCMGAKMLQMLTDYGYTLYTMPTVAHPMAGGRWKGGAPPLPLDDLEANCRWYFDLEIANPLEGYKMGYWSDILAVAPGASLPDGAVTNVGKVVQRS